VFALDNTTDAAGTRTMLKIGESKSYPCPASAAQNHFSLTTHINLRSPYTFREYLLAHTYRIV
jgi:hypothetical protein